MTEWNGVMEAAGGATPAVLTEEDVRALLPWRCAAVQDPSRPPRAPHDSGAPDPGDSPSRGWPAGPRQD
jgi:hypothetical protein